MGNCQTEPTIDDLLRDPIAQMLMARDGLRPEVIWTCIRRARMRLAARRGAPIAPAASSPGASGKWPNPHGR